MAEQKGKMKQGKDSQKPKKAPRAGTGAGRKAAYTRYEVEGHRARNKLRNQRREQKRRDDKRIHKAKRAARGKGLMTAREIRRYGK